MGMIGHIRSLLLFIGGLMNEANNAKHMIWRICCLVDEFLGIHGEFLILILMVSMNCGRRSNLQEESVKDFKSNLCVKSVEVEEETISLEKSSDTTPCRSLLTSDYSVSTHRLQLMVSAVARYRSMKLKVARRARTKVIYRGYNDQKSAPKSWAKPQAKTPNKASTSQVITEGTTTTTTESSCLSSGGTSEISSGRNRGKAAAEQKRRRGTGPTYISRRAEAILRLLSCKGCASEVRIRQLLGDSPDTSKALRMLLRMEEVKRSGAGGRIDPFIYTIAEESNSSILN